MSHLRMNFANEATEGTPYKLVCKNDSTVPWVFYVYQTMPSQPSDVFSLAWFASPYKLSPGSTITFDWTIDYSFVWGNTGTVSPGVNYQAGGSKSCSLTGPNMTTFSTDDNAPQLSNPVPGGQAGSLTINEASNVPNGTYSTGIGMSGQGTFVQQALTNATQVYTPEPKYWIAAATEMQMGVVLAQNIAQTAEIDFPNNTYTMYATLKSDQTWNISANQAVLNEALVDY
ncbi:protein RhiA [Flavivirga eckloniae]|uniref:Protein RhiA n=1 Tax=Flavivirga eckloniae TaxID=1803846 RepID=A0A2K9PT41_9FLAO|nr:protein RhiA [Flavivirga eckloniae]AUP80209.1 protein RhiA [Flavivirga eckloniae]